MKRGLHYTHLILSYFFAILVIKHINYSKFSSNYDTLQTHIIPKQKSCYFAFSSWLLKKIRKPNPPLQLNGENWLPAIRHKEIYELSFEFVVKSLVQTNVVDEPQAKTRSFQIQQLNEILDENTHYVLLQNINNQYIFNKLNPFFAFSSMENVQITNIRQCLASLINTLRISGYFSKVNLTYRTNQKTITFYLELKLNNILTEVEFQETQNLLIPKENLEEFASKLIGYPNSLTQLNLLSEKIKHWYSCRGYTWVHVKNFNYNNKLSKVYFKITEGILEKLTYKICPLVDHEIEKLTPLDKFIPTNFVDEIMSVYLTKGSLPTLFNVEKAMRILKDTRFFYNFYYDVNFVSDTRAIEIIIHFVPYRDNEIRAALDKIIKKIDLMNLHEKKLQNLFHKVFISKSQDSLSDLFLDTDLNIVSSTNLVNRYIYGADYNYALDSILLNFDVQNSLYDIELGLDENFELHQHHSEIYLFQNLHYLKNKCHFSNFTFREKDYISQYDFSYDTPLNVNKKTFVPLTTRIFDNLTMVKSGDQRFLFNNKVHKKSS